MTEIKKSTKFEIPFAFEPLSIILMCALTGIATNECQRSSVRLNADKARYQLLMDSINAHKTDTVKPQTFIFDQKLGKKR